MMNKRVILTFLAVAGIVLLSVVFRFYDIQNYPAGLFPDEAANGEDALLILDGDYRPFYPRGNGREGLFFFLEALAIRLFGIGVWQLHIVSAMVGVMTVMVMYFATRVWFGRMAGILAALFLATNHWHVTLSRTGFRAILIPLFVALFTALVGYTIRSVKREKKLQSFLFAALAGATLAGGFYTYIAYRMMVGVIVGIFVLLLLAAIHPKIGFPHFKRYGWQLIVSVAAALLVFAPLGWFFVQQPNDFVGRVGQVSVFNEELQDKYGGGELLPTIWYSFSETVMSFFAGNGDLNWRHNVAGFPLLNPLVGVLFLLGLAWTIRGTAMVGWKLLKGQEVHLGMIYPYVLLLAAGMLAPVISTAEGIPHGLRSIGLVVPIFLLAGTAGAVVLHWCQYRVGRVITLSVCNGAIISFLLLGVLYDGSLYFMVAWNDAEAHYAYRADLTEVAKYINNFSGEGARPYLILDKFSLQTVHFLTSVDAHDYTVGDEVHPDVNSHRWRQVDPEKSHLVPLLPGEFMIFTQSTMFDTKRYVEKYPEIELVESRTNRFGQEIMRVYIMPLAGPDVEGVWDEEGGTNFDLDA